MPEITSNEPWLIDVLDVATSRCSARVDFDKSSYVAYGVVSVETDDDAICSYDLAFHASGDVLDVLDAVSAYLRHEVGDGSGFLHNMFVV